MVKCSICKNEGHSATTCDGQFVTEWTEKLTAFWIHGYNNSAENDEAVKHWIQNQRFTWPLVNRLWKKLTMSPVCRQKQWWKIHRSQVIRERFAEIRFIYSTPKTVGEFRLRILNYVRPAEPEIDMARVEIELEEERAAMARQLQQEEQERRDAAMARQLQQRERDAANPNAVVRRNLQREFDRANEAQNRANEAQMRAQAQAIQALKSTTKSASIQAQMDPLETDYFINADCPICMEPQTPGNTIALDCRHTCCVSCLKRTLKPTIKNCCPSCRNPITKVRFKPDITPENFNIISTHIHSLA
jgi:hypothetical protein